MANGDSGPGPSGPTPWNVLSGAIRKRVNESHERAQKQKEEERQTEYKAWEGVLTNPASTEEERRTALDHLRKQVPKETIPLIEGYHKMVDAMHRLKRGKSGAGKQGQGQGPGDAGGGPGAGPVASPGAAAGEGGRGGGTPPTAPPPSGTPVTTPQAAPGAASGAAGDTSLAKTLSDVSARAPGVAGRMEGQAESAKESILSQSRLATVKAMRNSYAEKGEEGLPKELDNALTMWAVTGHFPTGTMTRPHMHPVTVVGPDQSLIPGMQDDQGYVWANGEVIENPTVMPKWKPRHGYAKDAQGKFFSFAIDPQTNQPVPGTENYEELPPASYLEHVRQGMYHWTDDSGGVHESPFSVGSFVKVPSNAEGRAVPAVPPAFAKLPKPQGKGAGGTKGAGTGTGGRILGTKDTGVLSPVGQRALMTTEPVANQAKKLAKIIEDAGLTENNQAGYLLMPYILYRLGYASEGALESEIAGLSLGSVIEAASALQGSSRAISALRLAMVHTPNAKLDSPKQIYNKLHNDIIPRLDDIIGAANKYGRKRTPSTVGPGAGAGDTAVPQDMRQPPGKSSPDAEADKWLKEHGIR